MLDQLRTFRYWTTLGNNVAGEILATCALRQSDRLLRRASGIVAENASLLADFVAARPEQLTHRPAQAGTTVLVELGSASATAIATRMAQQSSVWAVPGAVLHVPDVYLRIGLGRADLAPCLDALDQCLSAGVTSRRPASP